MKGIKKLAYVMIPVMIYTGCASSMKNVRKENDVKYCFAVDENFKGNRELEKDLINMYLRGIKGLEEGTKIEITDEGKSIKLEGMVSGLKGGKPLYEYMKEADLNGDGCVNSEEAKIAFFKKVLDYFCNKFDKFKQKLDAKTRDALQSYCSRR